MLNQLESNYDCSNAGTDLHQLKQELKELRSGNEHSTESNEIINRLENQINFILNKCDIH